MSFDVHIQKNIYHFYKLILQTLHLAKNRYYYGKRGRKYAWKL